MSESPFCDPLVVRDVLYATPDRLARRTDALHRAKRSGRHAAHVITALADDAVDHRNEVSALEIDCGRGTASRVIGEQLSLGSLTLLDISAPLLTAARERLRAARFRHRRPPQGRPPDRPARKWCYRVELDQRDSATSPVSGAPRPSDRMPAGANVMP